MPPLTRRAACSAIVASAAALASPKRRWRLATSSVQFRHLPVERACEAIAQAGYEAVDFWPDTFQCPHLEEIDKRLGPAGLKRLLGRTRLKLSAFTAYRQPSSVRYGELLGRCGGGVMVRDSKYGRFPDRRQAMAEFIESLQPELAAAERYGYVLAVENHGKALLEGCDALQIFVEMADHPRLGVALAPYHLLAAGESVEEAIRIAGKKLQFVYAWQPGEGLNQLPGYGPSDFAFLRTLTEIGYTGYVHAFMHGDEPSETMVPALTRSRRFLARMAERGS
jgi:sugar phosphate isomerase/epimerase